MIQVQTTLKVFDNSGGKEAHCIRVLGSRKIGSLGNLAVVSLRKITKMHKRQNKKVSVGKVYRFLIVQTKKERQRFDGSYIQFSMNGGILLNNQNQPIGSRIKCTVPIELRELSYLKAISLGSYLV